MPHGLGSPLFQMKPSDITLFLQSFFPDCSVEESKTGRSEFQWKLKSTKTPIALLPIVEKCGKRITALSGDPTAGGVGEYEDIGLPALAKIVSKNMMFWKAQLAATEERVAASHRRKASILQVVADIGQDERAKQRGETCILLNGGGSMELSSDSVSDTVSMIIRLSRLSLTDARNLGLLFKPFMVACR